MDDDKQQLEIALQYIKNIGYKGTTIENGEKAVAYLENNQTDIIVLDMLLGAGMYER